MLAAILLLIAIGLRSRLLLLRRCLTIIPATAVVTSPATALSGCGKHNQGKEHGNGELFYAFHVRSLLIRYRTVVVRRSIQRVKRVKIIQHFRVLV